MKQRRFAMYFYCMIISICSLRDAKAGTFTVKISNTTINVETSATSRLEDLKKKLVAYMSMSPLKIQDLNLIPRAKLTLLAVEPAGSWDIEVRIFDKTIDQVVLKKQKIKGSALRQIFQNLPILLSKPSAFVLVGPPKMKIQILKWRAWLRTLKLYVLDSDKCIKNMLCRKVNITENGGKWEVRYEQYGAEYSSEIVSTINQASMRHALRRATWTQSLAMITLSNPDGIEFIRSNTKKIENAIKSAFENEGIFYKDDAKFVKVELKQVGNIWLAELEKPACVVMLPGQNSLTKTVTFQRTLKQQRTRKCLGDTAPPKNAQLVSQGPAPPPRSKLPLHSKALLATSIIAVAAAVGFGVWSMAHNRYFLVDVQKATGLGIVAISFAGISAGLQILFWTTIPKAEKANKLALREAPHSHGTTQPTTQKSKK